MYQLLEIFENHLKAWQYPMHELAIEWTPNGIAIRTPNHEMKVTVTGTRESTAGMLSDYDKHRLLTLDRKAKGGWLSHAEDLEFTKLLELQSRQCSSANSC